VQDDHSLSAQANVLRGLHFQKGDAAQTKLIRVVTGVVFDVVVDMRKGRLHMVSGRVIFYRNTTNGNYLCLRDLRMGLLL